MNNTERGRDQLGRFLPELELKICERCGETFHPRSRRKPWRFCSKRCRTNVTRYIDPMGYVCVKKPDHPNATTNGWVREHIVIATEKLGRNLRHNENVHHLDGDKQNNHPDNLTIVLRSIHTRLHFGNPSCRGYGEENPFIPCECGCGRNLLKYDSRGRPRRYIVGHSGK